MFDQMFGSQPANLQRALDRASLRHQLISKNLANVNTPGYKRQDIEFGITLDQEMKKPFGRNTDRSTFFGDEELTTDMGSNRIDGSSVDLEKEVVAMAETELHFQTLTEMTSRYFSDLKSVIREGK